MYPLGELVVKTRRVATSPKRELYLHVNVISRVTCILIKSYRDSTSHCDFSFRVKCFYEIKVLCMSFICYVLSGNHLITLSLEPQQGQLNAFSSNTCVLQKNIHIFLRTFGQGGRFVLKHVKFIMFSLSMSTSHLFRY